MVCGYQFGPKDGLLSGEAVTPPVTRVLATRLRSSSAGELVRYWTLWQI